MRMYTFVLIILILAVVLPDLFFFIKLRKRHAKWFLHVLNFIPTIFFIVVFLLMKFSGKEVHDPDIFHVFMWFNFVFMLIYIPKIHYLTFHFLNFLLNLFLKKKTYIIRYFGIASGLFIAGLMLHGAFINTTNFEVKTVNLKVKDLPVLFEGFRIVQLSDIHLGSWGKNHSYLEPAIQIINDQNADILIFSGDMVNNFKEETEGWSPLFRKMRAKSGKYAILGNHDYGDYSNWKNPEDKIANLNALKDNIKTFGFDLLLNETKILKQGGDSIEIMGVENWGKPPFPKYGNLIKALENSNDSLLKILISHDPSHWRAEVTGREKIFLTLSGHTHAAQLAFRFGEKLYSPSSWMYPEWDGLYQEKNQYLYINKGLGFIGIPLRIGAARPEITVLILHQSK